MFCFAVAIDLIVQHIRDFLNNRSYLGSTTNMALYMNMDLCGNVGDGAVGAGKQMKLLCKARPH